MVSAGTGKAEQNVTIPTTEEQISIAATHEQTTIATTTTPDPPPFHQGPQYTISKLNQTEFEPTYDFIGRTKSSFSMCETRLLEVVSRKVWC